MKFEVGAHELFPCEVMCALRYPFFGSEEVEASSPIATSTIIAGTEQDYPNITGVLS